MRYDHPLCFGTRFPICKNMDDPNVVTMLRLFYISIYNIWASFGIEGFQRNYVATS
jgi:hypothetical protein